MLSAITNFIYHNFITNTFLTIKTSGITIWDIATGLLELEKDDVKEHSIIDIINCTRVQMEYSQTMLNFVKCHSNLIATTKVALVPMIPNKSNPRKLVNNVIDKLTIPSNYKGIKLVTNFYKDIPDIIIADSYRLEAILTQLITNAINFTAKEGIVKVATSFFPASHILSEIDKDCGGGEATRGKDTLQFIVHDTGIGMSEEQQQYIYKQLNGLDSSTFTSSTSKATGEELVTDLGLGLSLVKQFIGNLNGKVNITSQQGKGTSFTLQVPVTLYSTEELNDDNNITNN
ncbi:sensor histidine kinase [Candidatus Tisiphia endosymbiont of Hybos culiciformis]|uniref:sensor histidine kinase n=1 Tax=Candidatus Tisiphia endosymbiont of Hybos culiciformis TaxID=3139331 RepID=UPI003CCB00C5